jgi:hypothetical protein
VAMSVLRQAQQLSHKLRAVSVERGALRLRWYPVFYVRITDY